MIEKNKTYTTEITGVGEKGEGIGRIEGFAVFIPYALMGETVEYDVVYDIKLDNVVDLKDLVRLKKLCAGIEI